MRTATVRGKRRKTPDHLLAHVSERQELPLLAESAQASLKKIGIEVQIQCTANHLELLKKGNWDVYVSAFVSAPTGDPEYFFTTHCLQDSSRTAAVITVRHSRCWSSS